MFQFRRFPTHTYVFSIRYMAMTPCGLPHSDICGSKPACGSPQLFAARCVLRRLLMPRHSPCALCSLTIPYVITCSHSRYYSFPIIFASLVSSHCSVFKVHFLTCKGQKSKARLLAPYFRSLLFLGCWWAQVDSNHRPHAYQACALTT